MPGGLIRKGIFNRKAASAISGVESLSKTRDSDSAFMLRPCVSLPRFAKGRFGTHDQRQQSGCGFLPSVRMERVKQSIVLIVAFCVVACLASANLGDNSERIEDTYGTIVQRRLRDDGTVSVVYTKGRYLYLVTF